MPVYRKVVEADPEGWFYRTPRTTSATARYKMVSWQHNAKIELVPNPNYWNRRPGQAGAARPSTSSTTSDRSVDVRDRTARLVRRTAGCRDRTPGEGRLLLHKSEYIGTYYYMFNVTKKPLDDAKSPQGADHGHRPPDCSSTGSSGAASCQRLPMCRSDLATATPGKPTSGDRRTTTSRRPGSCKEASG
jgi:hypothetical protein